MSTRRRLEWEIQEWQKRAELAAARPPVVVKVRTPWFTRVSMAGWLFVIGLLVGGMGVPHINDKPALASGPDYSACISFHISDPSFYPQATRYQKLVNALWTCEVFHGK